MSGYLHHNGKLIPRHLLIGFGSVLVWLTTTAMHIPDGFLSLLVALSFWVLSVAVVGIALSRIRHDLRERQVPLMGVLAAVIFAGQMLNFSVAGGTSGHLVGAALASILLGPWPAVLVLTSVISVQALVFQDGGLLALGANLFNMAVAGVFIAWGIYRLLVRILPRARASRLLAGFTAAWASTVGSALLAALELALSGTSPANIAIPAMGGIHALIGIGEGLITAGALAFLASVRPGLFEDNSSSMDSRLVWIGGLATALLLAILSPLASTHPDGLMHFAEQTGFAASAQSPLYTLIPKYIIPGISNTGVSTILAGILGVGLIFGAALLISRIRKNKRTG